MANQATLTPLKIGLALGSGSARGWAHIGVIEALAEAGVRVDCAAGTSIGAVVGAVFASGRLESFKQAVLGLDWKRIASLFDFVFPKSGLIDGGKVADFIRPHLAADLLEDLPLPFRASAADLATGGEVVFAHGDVMEAIRASISIPGVFTPARIGGRIFVDGGLVNPVPVSVVRDMGADFVIAVDLNHDLVVRRKTDPAALPELPPASGEKNNFLDLLNQKLGAARLSAIKQIRRRSGRTPYPSIFEVLLTSLNIMEAQITTAKLQAHPPDLLIRPRLGHINFLEFNRAREAIEEGYRQTKRSLKALGRGAG
jgi:NTE family protein